MFKVLMGRLRAPKPSSKQLDGLVVLLVGANTGIGLAAAKLLAEKNVSSLIVTARDAQKAAETKTIIEQHLASRPQPQPSPRIIPLVVEMTSPTSIYSFVEELKASVDHLDQAIISAGILPGNHQEVETGYEASIQVNVLSPTLLALLLTPMLLASPLVGKASVTERPHLTIVSSGMAWLTKRALIEPFFDSAKPLTEFSKSDNFPSGLMAGQDQYCRSKLATEYAMRHLAPLPSLHGPDGKSKVLVVSVCPGTTGSDLSRNVMPGGMLGFVGKKGLGLIARTPQQGANIYMTSLHLGQEVRGEMWVDDMITQDHLEYVLSKEGQRFGDAVWGEIKEWVMLTDAKMGTGLVRSVLGGEN